MFGFNSDFSDFSDYASLLKAEKNTASRFVSGKLYELFFVSRPRFSVMIKSCILSSSLCWYPESHRENLASREESVKTLAVSPLSKNRFLRRGVR